MAPIYVAGPRNPDTDLIMAANCGIWTMTM